MGLRGGELSPFHSFYCSLLTSSYEKHECCSNCQSVLRTSQCIFNSFHRLPRTYCPFVYDSQFTSRNTRILRMKQSIVELITPCAFSKHFRHDLITNSLTHGRHSVAMPASSVPSPSLLSLPTLSPPPSLPLSPRFLFDLKPVRRRPRV